MRKAIVFISLVGLVLLAGSCGMFNTIAYDASYKGERYILTTDKSLFGNFDVALGFKIAGRDTVMGIRVVSCENSNHGVFNKGDKLQIRTTDGTVINLTNVYDKEYKKEVETGVTETPRTDFGYAYSYSPFCGDIYVTPYAINRMVVRPYSYTNTYSYALYLISKAQLNKIVKNGVVKLRIETESDVYDAPSPGDFRRIMKRCLHDVRVQAKHNPKEAKGEF